MRIPVSQGPQVDLNPLSGATFTAPNVQGPSIPRAIAGALGEMDQARQEADHLRIEDQMNTARAQQTDIWQKASQQLGKNVLPANGKTFTDQNLEQFDGSMQKMEDGLQSNNQRRLFKQRSDLLRQNLSANLQDHEAKQMVAYKKETHWGTIALEDKTAQVNMDNPNELALGQVRIEGALGNLATLEGWAPERAAVERGKALTDFHGSVIGAALDAGKLGYAKDYLNAHGGELDPSVRIKFDKIINSASTDSQSVDLARSALDAARNAGLDRTKGYEFIDKQSGNNKDLRDKSMAEYDHSFNVYKDQRKELQDQDTASVWTPVLQGEGPQAAFKAIGAAKNLDDTDKAALVKKVQTYYKGDAEDRTAQREAKKEAQASALLTYKLNPDSVWKMTENQFMGLLPDLGANGVNELVNMKKGMQAKGPVNATADAETFKDVAIKAGLNPANAKNAAALADAKTKIEVQIDEEQRANGQHPNRELPRARRDEITRYWFSQVLTQQPETHWYKSNGPDTENVTKRRFDVADPQSVIRAIPPEHNAAIVRYLETQSALSRRPQPLTLSDLAPDQIIALEQQLFPQGK